MAVYSAQKIGQPVRVCIGRINAVYHGVFKSYPPACLRNISPTGFEKLLNIICTIDRHYFTSCGIFRTMKRNAERKPQFQLRQFVNFRNDTAGRKRNMTQTEIIAVLRRKQFQKFQNVVVVIERFADAHEYKSGNFYAGIFFSLVDLHQDLRRRKISYKSGNSRSTESAPHFAAHLSGNAKAETVTVFHQNRLNKIPVGKSIQIFYSIIYRRFKSFLHK